MREGPLPCKEGGGDAAEPPAEGVPRALAAAELEEDCKNSEGLSAGVVDSLGVLLDSRVSDAPPIFVRT
jgi:hypothetical protein